MKNINIFIRKGKIKTSLRFHVPLVSVAVTNQPAQMLGKMSGKIPYLLLVGMEISPTTVQITVEKYYK